MLGVMPRHLPPPWKAEKIPGGFVVRDASGQALAYVYSRANEALAMPGQGPDRGRGAPRRRQHCAAARAAGAQGVKAARKPEAIAATLSVPERILLFCIASDTDWQKATVTGETVTVMVVKGLVERDAAGYESVLSKQRRICTLWTVLVTW
jgi:hypothetical protein